MTKSVQDVMGVLEGVGFERLPKPLSIAGTEFDFEAAARGTHHSHDLVLVATDEVPRPRLLRLVAGLARSLDLAASKRPINLVLIGEVVAKERSELERYARVLSIDARSPDIAQIEQSIAVLMPLELPAANLVHGSDPINEVMAALGTKATSEHIALVKSAVEGTESVRQKLRRFANEGAGWSDDEKDAEYD